MRTWNSKKEINDGVKWSLHFCNSCFYSYFWISLSNDLPTFNHTFISTYFRSFLYNVNDALDQPHLYNYWKNEKICFLFLIYYNIRYLEWFGLGANNNNTSRSFLLFWSTFCHNILRWSKFSSPPNLQRWDITFRRITMVFIWLGHFCFVLFALNFLQ